MMENFLNGAHFLRADFHLHTRADKEFVYKKDENAFIDDYIEALKKSEIKLGVITNHNKFDIEEFKKLSKKAFKEGVYLLPGVELSVRGGQSGLHIIIVFDDKTWIVEHDHVNSFISNAFPGDNPNQYENNQAHTRDDLLGIIEKLDRVQKDYFLIFAHVEQSKGLWQELKPGQIQELFKKDIIKDRILAFQKVRTRDTQNTVKQSLAKLYPAEVEGSDPKNIEGIGKGKAFYLKLGEFSFSAVKFALMNQSRVSTQLTDCKHAYVESISIKGGRLDNQTIYLSPELNTLIGIRGSGKSSILESIRYALGADSKVSGGVDSRKSLLGATLGQGSEITLNCVSRYKQKYQIKRLWNGEPSVFIDGQEQADIFTSSVISKYLYYGQNELSSDRTIYETTFIEKFLDQDKLREIRSRIDKQKTIVLEKLKILKNKDILSEEIQEKEKEKRNAEHELNLYREHGLEKKLQEQSSFESDLSSMSRSISYANDFLEELKELLAKYGDDIRNSIIHKSENNSDIFAEFIKHYAVFIKFIDSLKAEELEKSLLATKETLNGLEERKHIKAAEFAAIERQLIYELKQQNIHHINIETFLKLQKTIHSANAYLEQAKKQESAQSEAKSTLLSALEGLANLWQEEHQCIENELVKINQKDSSIRIEITFKGNKDKFLDQLRDMVKGTGIRQSDLEDISRQYSDFIAVYRDLENVLKIFSTVNYQSSFLDSFAKNYENLLIYQVPDEVKIYYQEKLLEQLSLGQRASALILFILNQHEDDLIIIDQPEDDLDNQTIYESVIKKIQELKPNTQFIFATHNPNIPVLADAEQVLACSFEEKNKIGKILVDKGAIDNLEIQGKIISIMEGGQEAFNKRKEIYKAWKN